jgi:AraC-like DNA-binding protein
MTRFELDTSVLPTGKRMAAWSAAVSRFFGPFDMSANSAAPFRGRLSAQGRGRTLFVDFSYAGHNFHRRRRDLARLSNEFFSLTRPISGRLNVEQEGVPRRMEPGNIYVSNHAIRYDTAPDGAYRTGGFIFPAAALRHRVARLEAFYSLPLDPRSPRGDLLMSFVDHFSRGLAEWDERAFVALEEQLFDLIALLVLQPGAPAEADTSVRIAHRERALRFIREHLADPDLRPDTVARGCGISLSYLHQVFRASGRTVEEAIFEERLDRCRMMLDDPACRRLSLASIGYMNGFRQPSHFSRSFKRRFGCSPRDLRAK